MLLNNKEVKYIHLLYGGDLKFSKPLINFINDPENNFNSDEHLFITPYRNVYEKLKDQKNVCLDEKKGNLYIRYYKQCKLIISHGSETVIRMLLTPKKVKQRIILRYWGGSISTALNSSKLFQVIKYRIKSRIFKYNYEGFAGIGIANSTDIVDLSRILINVKYYKLSYASNDRCEQIDKLKSKILNRQNNCRKNILLGHRGTKENNHIELLKRLSNYNPDDINIFLLLSYGDDAYIKEIKEYIVNNSISNVNIIEKMMDFTSFSDFLSTIDIAIFDGITSYALGSISILLSLRKTIYLNENGVIKQALDMEKGPYKLTKDVGIIPYKEFIEPVVYPTDYKSDLEVMPIKERVDLWNKMFADFE